MPLKSQKIADTKFDLNSKLYIFARVNPEVFSAHRQERTIGEWIPIAGTGGRRYFVEVSLDANQETFHKLIDDIHCLLTAYFLTDFQPRDLIDFKVLTSKENRDLAFSATLIFGQSDFVEFPNSQDISEEKELITSPRISGIATFDSPTRNIQFSKDYPWDEIEENYTYLKDRPDLLRKLMLVRESFMNFNAVFSLKGYAREIELLTGIVILTAALESLLLKTDHDEIRFKFSLIGAVIYQRNVKKSDFSKGSLGKSKLTFEEAQDMFKTLYDIRSDIAHGTLNTVAKPIDKYWQKLGKIFKVSLVGNKSFALRMKTYGLIMTLLQYHIALLLKKSKNDFNLSQKEVLSFLKV